MSDTPNSPESSNPQDPSGAEPPPPMVIPVRYVQMPQPRYPAPSGPSFFGSLLRKLVVLLFAGSLGLNLVLLFTSSQLLLGGGGSSVREHYVSGNTKAEDKIAVVNLDGVIMEGQIKFVLDEIDQAAADEHVKAVVLRIVSPGGSITASDDLYLRLNKLIQGKLPKQKGGGKKVIASMGAMAASGGYYVAMPAEFVMAEQTTITGSIGVYAAFPNIADLAHKYGFSMNVIKSDAMKDSGSMFHQMSAPERYLWQGMVDNAYDRFLTVVAENRVRVTQGAEPESEKAKQVQIDKYKKTLTEIIPETRKDIIDRDGQGKEIEVDGKKKYVEFFRKRADGGIFTAMEAKEYGLIDGIGYLEDAVTETAKRAGLSNYKAISYDRPPSLMSTLLGGEDASSKQLDASKLAEGAIPRLWYLTPQAEMAGLLSAIGRHE